MKFTLPDLPYPLHELEPHISRDTLYYHHSFHHRGYVNKLNEALEKDTSFSQANDSIEKIILNYKDAKKPLQAAIKNNGGGHLNHSLFWTLMCSYRKPKTKIDNYSTIKEAIINSFKSYDVFVEEFQKEANKLFGSGWVWLVVNKESNKLEVVPTQGHDNPISQNLFPILVIDVWEHAYYLDYKNNRSEFVKAFFKIINWEEVEKHYNKAII